MKNYRSYIFRKLYISLIIISSILYLSVVARNIYVTREEEQREFEERVENLNNLVNSSFDRIGVYLNQIKYDEKFSTFIYEKEIDYYNLTLLQQELRKNSALIVNIGYSIGIKKDGLDTVVNFEDTSPKEVYYKNLGLNQRADLITEKIEKLRAYEADFYQTEDKIIYFYRDFDVNMVRKFTWIVAIDKQQFFDSLPSYDGFNFIIRNRGQDVLIKGDKLIEDIGKKILVDRGIFGNDYLYLSQKRSYKTLLLTIVTFLIIPLILINIAIYIFSKSISRVLYNPIKALKENLDMNEKDSIDLIEYTYAKLKEQNVFLEEKSKNIDIIYEEKQIKDFILGLEDKVPVALDGREYNLLLIEICDDEKYEENYSKEYLLTLKTKIEIKMKENFSARLLDIDYNHICFIYDKSHSREKLEKLFTLIRGSFDIDFRGAIEGNLKVGELNRAYKDLIKLLEYRMILVDEQLICKEKVEGINDDSYYYTFDIERKLVKKIVAGNLGGAIEILRDIFDENIVKRRINIENMLELKMQLINTAKRIVKQQEYEYDFEPLIKSNNVDEFKEEYLKLLKGLSEKTETYKDKSNIKVAIEQYLDEHYREDISLDMMSEYIGFSSKYLSSLFKQLFGENFKTTLDQKRIEKAKELMKEKPDIKVKEVAEEIGYNSANTFIRVFKKYEGVSPGSYR